MNYAPVIIPTLNRKKHLERCIKSLSKNFGAQFTELYISVDYPPSEKYILGYNEVKLWLKNINDYGFKEVHIIYQETNLGPKENILFLQNIVSKTSDRYILTEDDNEFSENFLEYMNKCLEYFKNDDKVIGVCASKSTEWVSENRSIVYSKLFSAYGYGTWVRIEQKLEMEGAEIILSPKTLDFKKMFDLYRKNRLLFVMYISEVLCKDDGIFWEKDKLAWCDTLRSIYLHLTEDVCIMPVLRKSRTWGNDGSGVNMVATNVNPLIDKPLDPNKSFEIDYADELFFDNQNYKMGDQLLSTLLTWKSILKAWIYYVLLMMLGKDRCKFIKITKKIKSVFRG